MASLCFLSLNKFFFIIISLSDVIKIIYFFLFILQHFIILSLCNSLGIQILMFSLSILCFLLFSPLYIIVSSYTTQSFVFISLPFDTSFVIMDGPFQFCRLIQLLWHHLSLPVFPVLLCFEILVIITQIFFYNVFVNILLFLRNGILLHIVVRNHLLEMIIQILLSL